MKYQAIDNILNKWAEKNGLLIYNKYHDDEVRSVEHRIDRRRGYQIWIDPPDEEDMVGIHVWNFRKLRRDFTVGIGELENHLELALGIANSWMD